MENVVDEEMTKRKWDYNTVESVGVELYVITLSTGRQTNYNCITKAFVFVIPYGSSLCNPNFFLLFFPVGGLNHFVYRQNIKPFGVSINQFTSILPFIFAEIVSFFYSVFREITIACRRKQYAVVSCADATFMAIKSTNHRKLTLKIIR